jgi:hypothetical protein
MGLPTYGVCIGTLDHFSNDGNVGQWLHGLAFLNTPEGQYRCAIDVDHPTATIQYRVLPKLDAMLFATLAALADGYHDLAKSPNSGALDYVRSPLLNPDHGAAAAGAGINGALWTDSTGDNALAVLHDALVGSHRVFIFGERYVDPRMSGMHNIHYNQGDPPGVHRSDDGTWQDGATIAAHPDGTLVAILTKFSTQSLNTDDNGLPI